MTAYELSLSVRGYMDRAKQERDDKISAAWLNQYFKRQKRLPPLKDFIGGEDKKEKKPQTAKDILAVVKALNAKFGGSEQKEG